MLSGRVAKTFSHFSYYFLVLITIVATGLSCAALLSQAVRNAPNKSWSNNLNALVIGASYIIVLAVSLLFCVKRTVAVRLKLQRISKVYKTIGHEDLPDSVHKYISQEYIRACLVAYESTPKNAAHGGWGGPGSKYEGKRFSRILLDTIPEIDALARNVIPLLPAMKPHARMLHHFRFIVPLLSADEDGMTPLHYYDSAIQLARNATKELTEDECELGMNAVDDIKKCLKECREEMSQDSISFEWK